MNVDQLGITYRQLDTWVRKGYIKGTAPGSGQARTFTRDEEQVAADMARLVKAGFTPASAAAVARAAVPHRRKGAKDVRARLPGGVLVIF